MSNSAPHAMKTKSYTKGVCPTFVSFAKFVVIDKLCTPTYYVDLRG